MEVVKKWKGPRTKKEVRIFWGMSGYYRFIPQYSVILSSVMHIILIVNLPDLHGDSELYLLLR